MANGLMNLSNLLGQSSNTQSGGLLGGGVFSQPMSRGQRRSKLLTDAISGAGQNPYARLGASFGGLLGIGGRAAAEGAGLVDKPQEVQRAEAIRQVQQEVAEQGLDPMANPNEFGEFVTSRFQELGQNELALRTQMQIRQMMPEGSETSRVIRGGTELGNAAGLSENESAIATFDAQGNLAGIKDRTQTERDETTVGSADRYINTQTGDRTTLVRTNRGLARQTVDSEGNPSFSYVNSGDFERVGARETGGPGGFSGGDFSELGELRNVTLDFANQAQRLQDELRPGTIGIPGAVARGVESATSQLQGVLQESFGVNLEAPTSVNAYSEEFENLGLAEASAETKSALVNLGVTKAYLDQRGGGDVRRDEVVRGLESLRVGSGSPDQIKAALGRTVESAVDRFNISRETAGMASGNESDIPFPALRREDFGLRNPSAERDPDVLTVQDIQSMSREDLAAINPDKIPNDPDVLGALQDKLNSFDSNNIPRSERQRGGATR